MSGNRASEMCKSKDFVAFLYLEHTDLTKALSAGVGAGCMLGGGQSINKSKHRQRLGLSKLNGLVALYKQVELPPFATVVFV